MLDIYSVLLPQSAPEPKSISVRHVFDTGNAWPNRYELATKNPPAIQDWKSPNPPTAESKPLILAYIKEHPDCRAYDIADALALRRTYVSAVLTLISKDGLAVRTSTRSQRGKWRIV